jgi:uncharacterized DUF497 family protein
MGDPWPDPDPAGRDGVRCSPQPGRRALVHAGLSSTGPLLAVSHTYSTTGPNSAKVRIISARQATWAERRQYEDEPH